MEGHAKIMKTVTVTNGAPLISDGRHLLELAREWMKQGNTAVAFQLLNQALKLKETDENKVLKGELSKEVGRVFMQSGQWDRAEEAYNLAQSIFLESGHLRGAAESARNLANMKFQQGQFDVSNALCETAIEWATKTGDFQLRATILNTQGAIKSIEGKQKESIQVFRLCLSDFRRSGNRLRQAYVLHNIGVAQTEVGQFAEAKISFEEALALALENRDPNLVTLCYINMAKMYLQNGDLIAARSLLRAAQDLLDSVKSPQMQVDYEIVLADSCRRGGDLEKSEKILDQALARAREHNLIQHEAEILYCAGLTASDRGCLDLARSRLEAAIVLFKKSGGGGLKKAVERLKAIEHAANYSNNRD